MAIITRHLSILNQLFVSGFYSGQRFTCSNNCGKSYNRKGNLK